jgi:hypothetical protein
MSENDFEAQFLYAAKNGYIERAERLLLDGNFDPSRNDNEIMKWATENGHNKVVQVLLKDKRVDPRAEEDVSLQLASANGHHKVLELLLQDGRGDPSTGNGIALWLACQNGHLKCVEMLLADPRIDKTAKLDDLSPLEVAVLHEHFDIGQLFLKQNESNSDTINSVKGRLPATRVSTEIKSIRRSITADSLPNTPNHLRLSKTEVPIKEEIAPIQQSREEMRARWLELITLRKSYSLEFFTSQLLLLPLLDSVLLNELLVVIAGKFVGKKDARRGTTFDYTQLILRYCEGKGLEIYPKTIAIFKKRYRMTCIKSPVSLLANFS